MCAADRVLCASLVDFVYTTRSSFRYGSAWVNIAIFLKGLLTETDFPLAIQLVEVLTIAEDMILCAAAVYKIRTEVIDI